MKKYLLAISYACVALFSGIVSANTLVEGRYTTLSQPQPPLHTENIGQKVEVLEFFSYACHHCYDIDSEAEQLIDEFKGNPNVHIERIPVGFNPVLLPLQKLYYTVETLKKPELHRAIFDAVINQRKNLTKPDVLSAFINSQDVDSGEFYRVFNSFGVDVLARRSSQATVNYQVNATPIWIVSGKYRVDGETAGSNEEAIKVVRALIQRELGEFVHR